MSTLVIDTSMVGLLLGLTTESTGEVFTVWHDRPQDAASRLPGLCADLLESRGLSTADLTSLVLGCGPGSFTGVKIGISFGRGLLLSKPNIKVKAVSSFFSFFRDRLAPFDLALLQSTATSAYYLRRDENAFSSGIIQSEGAWQLEARTNDGNLLKKYSAFGAGKIHLFSESDLLRSQIAKQHPNLIWELYPIKDHFPEIINAMLREAEKLGDNCNQFDPIYLKKAAPEEKLVLQK